MLAALLAVALATAPTAAPTSTPAAPAASAASAASAAPAAPAAPAASAAPAAPAAPAASAAPGEPTSSAAPRPARPVYQVDARIDGAVAAASALTIAVPALLASRIIRERCPCDPRSVNGFDRGAVGNHSDLADYASTATVALAVAAPAALDWALLGRGDALASDLVVFGETLLVNGAVVQVVKYSVQRPLPRTYAGDPGLVHSPSGYRSFYSGHTSTAMAALTAAAYTARRRYGEQGWPWLVAAGVGASVAVERVAAGRHFPTDVIAGAAAGTAIGLAVPWLHDRAPSLAILPVRGGLALAGRF